MGRTLLLVGLLSLNLWGQEVYRDVTIPTDPPAAEVWLGKVDGALDTGQKTDKPVRLERADFFDSAQNPVSRTLIFRLPGHEEVKTKVNWGNLSAAPLTQDGKPFRLPPKNLYYAALDHWPMSLSLLLAVGAGLLVGRQRTLQAAAQQERAEAAQLRALQEEARQQAEREKALQAQRQAQEEAKKAREQQALLAVKQQSIQDAAGKDPWIGMEITSQRMGTYCPTSVLGAGGMGTVYEARLVRGKPISPAKLALKIVDVVKRPAIRLRAISEGQVGMQIVHPSIVRCYDYIELPEAICLFQELVEGKLTLQSKVQAGGMDPRLALELLLPVAQALLVMHGKGYVHRDIKPENIMIDGQGVLKIADLGLAKNPHASFQTDSQDTLGTFAYCAPEQIATTSKVTGQADQYALGCLLYELIEGRLPFVRSDFIQYASAHLQETPPPVQKLSAPANQALLKMLEKDPQMRYADTVEAVRAVQAAVGP